MRLDVGKNFVNTITMALECKIIQLCTRIGCCLVLV